MAYGPITSWEIEEDKMEAVTDFIFLGSKITADGDFSHIIKDTCSLDESYDKPRQHIKKQRHQFANKSPYSQSYDFTSSHVQMWRRQWHPTLVLLPGKSHGRRSLVGCNPWGPWELDTSQWLHFQFSLSCIGEGNGNPLQCSCLEIPRDGGAWWAAVYGVAQSRTRLKRLSSSSSNVYGCEICTIKKTEYQRIDAFELWCWRRLLRVYWSTRRWNQPIIKESILNIHWKDWFWNWDSNTLASWYEEPFHRKSP